MLKIKRMTTFFNIIGIMSGTSLDGVDITYVKYEHQEDDKWSFKLVEFKTYPYPLDIRDQLRNATSLSVTEICKLDKKIGLLIGSFILDFILEKNIVKKEIDLIASHGHTILHQPQNGFTLQIGCGTSIAISTNIHVVNDFRTKDIVLGGQGAPLVPVGDLALFSGLSDGFLNIGGITNCCYSIDGNVKAFDISPGNIPLNKLMNSLGKSYDPFGENARNGVVDVQLLDELNALDFYKIPPPKSLGIEWINRYFDPIIDRYPISIENKLNTIVEHIAQQISAKTAGIKSLYTTGGGVYNSFLIERINANIKGKIIIPSNEIIEFKEAIIFGFLGALYLKNIPNSLKQVTGSQRDSCGGILHTPY